ncbi:tachylectin-related carbohydrate-binding protein [Streptosporangium lutulentum]
MAFVREGLLRGQGVIFAIGTDGILTRYHHRGYATGTHDWGPHIAIGTGWNSFQEVVAGPDGVFYAFTRDGRILWYCYRGERPAPLFPPGGAGGHDPHIWEGPVEIKRGVPGFKSVFRLMDPPYHGPN